MADSLVQDFRYALGTLRRAPLFALTVAVTMGLGLGLLGSAFTVLNAYLLQPIDLPNPRALYSLSWDTDATLGRRFSLADYEALQPEARRFAGVAGVQNVVFMEGAVATPGLLVTGNYFELLGTRPALGRLLRPDDAATRGARVAAAGLVAGLAVAAGIVRLSSGSIPIVPEFGVRPYAVGAAIVLLATAVAALAPLRTAARTDPARALRTGE